MGPVYFYVRERQSPGQDISAAAVAKETRLVNNCASICVLVKLIGDSFNDKKRKVKKKTCKFNFIKRYLKAVSLTFS